MTENQFKDEMVNLFKKHDDNGTGAIEKGSEFDAFISDYFKLIGSTKNVSRDEAR